MESFKNVELIKKANIYFDGNVTSRTFIDTNGSKKSLGIMMVGEYLFGTAEAEIMEIIEGHVEVRLKGESEWKSYRCWNASRCFCSFKRDYGTFIT